MALCAKPRHLPHAQQPCEWCKEEGQGQGLVTFKLVCSTESGAISAHQPDQSGTREGLYSVNPSPLLFPVT